MYLEQQKQAIQSLEELLHQREQQLADERSDVSAHNQLVRKIVSRRGGDVAAEDALDTILRLEALIKLEQRRNELLARENVAQRSLLSTRRDELKKIHDQFGDLQHATGWSPDHPAFRRNREDAQHDIEQMRELEQKLVRNLKAAELIIAKKNHTIVLLQEELKKKKAIQEQLHEVHNHIRVKDRDCQEATHSLKQLATEGDKRDQALVSAQNSKDVYAFECIRDDNKYLRDQLHDARRSKAKLDDVGKLQLERLGTLKSRMAVLAAAMHDLRVDSRYAQHAQQSGGAVIVATPIATEDDIDLAIAHARPEDEAIAPECFDLLSRDLEQMKAMLSRKEIILLEKQLVVESLEGKVENLGDELEQADADRTAIQRQTENEIDSLRGALQGKHDNCRFEIDQMLNENRRLRQKINVHENRRTKMLRESEPAKPKWSANTRN